MTKTQSVWSEFPEIESNAMKLLKQSVFAAAFLSTLITSSAQNTSEKQIQARKDVGNLRLAIKMYLSEYGKYPWGTQAEIMAALRARDDKRNPRKTAFFEADDARFNKSGEFLDPWGTPYRIDTADPENLKVHSCGPDKKDDKAKKGSDDIASS